MISSFEKYIKAAIDAKKYSVVCEMANIVHSDKNHINIMTYPGKDVRVYKNRDDEVQILCPKNISYVQESNLTKAISTGTIFDNADDVDKYAGFIVKTKMPIDAMTNKGLENPYKLREVVGSTIGVMNKDGEVDVSDADVDNGNNIIDDLLKKDSKEFKDVKNVVDDYLDNDDHSFGYDTDFTTDIQQLRDEINRFKDADIAPEDSITDADWDDNWGSTSSIMGDHTDAEDEENEDDDLKRSHADDDLDNDTDVSYNMKKECGDGSISSDPSSGGNVNTTMEEDDTTTPMPAFSSGSGTDIQTESDEVDESFTPKAVVPDDLDAAPSDDHNPLLSSIHEGFMMKRPKKLKAIDIRGIVSYVTIEMNDIKDANDQAMIAGYVCSKLELIDFYITVLDTHDDRYVVPHTRQYLVDGQRQLSDLLTRILKIRPINRADRIWQIEKII